MKLTVLLLALSLHAQPPTWTAITPVSPPRFVGQGDIHYDPVSHKTWFYQARFTMTGVMHTVNGSPDVTWVSGETFGYGWGPPGIADTLSPITINGHTYACKLTVDPTHLTLWSNIGAADAGDVAFSIVTGSIYSSDIFFYDPSNDTFTDPGIGNKTSTTDAGKKVFDTATLPGDRHPTAMNTVDTKRNWLWQTGGPHGTGSPQTPEHMWHLTLNSNVSTDSWHVETTVAHPGGTDDGGFGMRYDPVHDLIMYYGSTSSNNRTQIYCYTLDNPTPGTRTAAQIAGGCATADDWSIVDVIGIGGVHCNTDATKCPGSTAPYYEYTYAGVTNMLWHPVLAKFLMICTSSGSFETWTYTPATSTWAKLAPAHSPPIPEPRPVSDFNWVPMAYNTDNAQVYYHYQGATPEDWSFDGSDWTQLQTGSGPVGWFSMTYDQNVHMLIAYSHSASTPSMWEGAIATAATKFVISQ